MNQITVIAQAIAAIVPLIVRIVNLFVEAKRKGWIDDGRGLDQKLSEAKTDETRMALAKSLFDHRAE